MKQFLSTVFLFFFAFSGAFAQGLQIDPVDLKKATFGVDVGLGTVDSKWGYSYASGYGSADTDEFMLVPRAFVNYPLNKDLSVEVGFIYSGEAESKGVGSDRATFSYWGADAAVLVKPSILKKQLPAWTDGLYVRGGFTYLFAEDKYENNGGTLVSHKSSGLGTQLGAGYEVPVGTGVLRAGWTYLPSIGGMSLSTSIFSVGYRLPLDLF